MREVRKDTRKELIRGNMKQINREIELSYIFLKHSLPG